MGKNTVYFLIKDGVTDISAVTNEENTDIDIRVLIIGQISPIQTSISLTLAHSRSSGRIQILSIGGSGANISVSAK